MLQAILFDLDSTLVTESIFFRPLFLFPILKKFFPFISSPYTILKAFYLAIEKVKSSPHLPLGKTNYEIFLESLHFSLKLPISQLSLLVEEILLQDLMKYASFFRPMKGAKESLKASFDLNIPVILATNPVFPLQAIKVRLKALDLVPEDFSFVTHAGNMSATKPHREYYQEIIKKQNLKPKECLMIGNDKIRDLIAYKEGFKTFWLFSSGPSPFLFLPLLKKNKMATYQGDHQQLLKIIKILGQK